MQPIKSKIKLLKHVYLSILKSIFLIPFMVIVSCVLLALGIVVVAFITIISPFREYEQIKKAVDWTINIVHEATNMFD